jgi:hypothetical protein
MRLSRFQGEKKAIKLLAIEPDGNHFLQTDFDFLMSQEALEIVKVVILQIL